MSRAIAWGQDARWWEGFTLELVSPCYPSRRCARDRTESSPSKWGRYVRVFIFSISFGPDLIPREKSCRTCTAGPSPHQTSSTCRVCADSYSMTEQRDRYVIWCASPSNQIPNTVLILFCPVNRAAPSDSPVGHFLQHAYGLQRFVSKFCRLPLLELQTEYHHARHCKVRLRYRLFTRCANLLAALPEMFWAVSIPSSGVSSASMTP